MTLPTVTLGQGYRTDCEDRSSWTADPGTVTGSLSATTMAVLIGDIFRIQGTCNDANDEYVIFQEDFTNISATLYTKYVLRYKTSASENGLGGQVRVLYSSPSATQYILGGAAPQFSTTWKTVSGDLDPGSSTEIEAIQFRANDYPDSVASGTYQVYYDFCLLHEGLWTIPFFNRLDIDAVNVYADLHPPGRGGGITQHLGMKQVDIRFEGDMQHGESSWGSKTGVQADDTLETYGEYLMRIHREMSVDPFQWFTSDLGNYKVTSRHLHLSEDNTAKKQRTWWWLLKGYSLSDLYESTWDELQWAGIT